MQEAPESGSSASSSFSSHPAASIKEEDCSPEKERPPEAEYINSRCVLFTYFQGDISTVVDEHFSRALSQPSSFSLGSAKAPRNAGSWRGEGAARRGGPRRGGRVPSGPAPILPPPPRIPSSFSSLLPSLCRRQDPSGQPLGPGAAPRPLSGKKNRINLFRSRQAGVILGDAA